MTDEQLRALVRDAVARRLGTRSTATDCDPPVAFDRSASCDHDRFGRDEPRSAPAAASSEWGHHPSHHLYLTVVNTTDACVIEPSVTCDHCGYCKSHGH